MLPSGKDTDFAFPLPLPHKFQRAYILGVQRFLTLKVPLKGAAESEEVVAQTRRTPISELWGLGFEFKRLKSCKALGVGLGFRVWCFDRKKAPYPKPYTLNP